MSTNQLMVVILLAIVCFMAQSTPIKTHHVVTQISIYYETLCPDSQRFFLRQLAPTYEKLNRYMDVELVPFGNANVSYPRHDNKPVFNCQHGPAECYGNRVQACAIEMLKNTELAIKYVQCMFAHSDHPDTTITADKCANELELDWAKIKNCANGSEGERLLIANSLKTFNLNPEHSYIPWIVIDKNHTRELQSRAENQLLKYLCETYFSHEPQIPQCSEEAIRSESQHSAGNGIKIDHLMLFPLLTYIIWHLTW